MSVRPVKSIGASLPLIITLALLAPTPATSAPMRVPTGGESSAVRPSKLCVASSTCFSGLRWSSWGSKSAVARGRVTVYSNATGARQDGRTKLTVDRVVQNRFTRAIWKYPKSFPKSFKGGRPGRSEAFNHGGGFWNWVIQASAFTSPLLVTSIDQASFVKTTSTAQCPSWRLRVSSTTIYRVRKIQRSPSVSCRTVKKIIRGVYGKGSFRPIGQGAGPGRPALYFREGWRATAGGGGGYIWNKNPKYNTFKPFPDATRNFAAYAQI